MTDEERRHWLEERRKSLGGSDAAAVLGVHPYKTPIDVFLEKKGDVIDMEPTEAMQLGVELEPVVVKRWEKRTGLVARAPTATIIRHPSAPFLHASLDRIFSPTMTDTGVLEAKTAGVRQEWRWGPEGTDFVPDEHAIQTRLYMSVIGAPLGDIAVLLLGSREFRAYRLVRDMGLENAILSKLEEWWEKHIVAGVTPDLGPDEGTARWLRQTFPQEMRGDVVDAGPEVDAIAEALIEARHAFDLAEEKKKTLEAEIKARIGDNAGVRGAWGYATWKKTRDSQKTDWEGVLRDLAVDVPADLIVKHSKTTEGARRLLVKPSKE